MLKRTLKMLWRFYQALENWSWVIGIVAAFAAFLVKWLSARLPNEYLDFAFGLSEAQYPLLLVAISGFVLAFVGIIRTNLQEWYTHRRSSNPPPR